MRNLEVKIIWKKNPGESIQIEWDQKHYMQKKYFSV